MGHRKYCLPESQPFEVGKISNYIEYSVLIGSMGRAKTRKLKFCSNCHKKITFDLFSEKNDTKRNYK